MPDLIRMYWDCPMCGRTGIISTERRCSCGYVFGTIKTDKFRMPGPGESIVGVKNSSDPDELLENWRCDFCGAYNKHSERICKTCGAPRDESSKSYFTVTDTEKSTRSKQCSEDDIYKGSRNIYEEPLYKDEDKSEEKVSAYSHSEDALSKNGNEPTSNPVDEEVVYRQIGTRTYAFKKSASIPKKEPYVKPPDLQASRRTLPQRSNRRLLYIVAAALLCFLTVFFLTRTTEHTYTVTGKEWSRSIDIEKSKTVQRSSWDIPDGARNIESRTEIRSYRQVFDHYETVNVTKYRSVQRTEIYYEDLGNGNAERRTRTYTEQVPYTETETQPVYRSVPVYDTKYYYDIDVFSHERYVETSGKEDKPYWGEVVLKSREREGARKEKYSILFMDKGKEKSVSVPYEKWKEFKDGEEIKLKKNNIGKYFFVEKSK